MFSVRKAVERYGSVDADDEWLPEFQRYDGLTIEKAQRTSSRDGDWVNKCLQVSRSASCNQLQRLGGQENGKVRAINCTKRRELLKWRSTSVSPVIQEPIISPSWPFAVCTH